MGGGPAATRASGNPMETLFLVIAIMGIGAITPGPNNFMVMAAGARGGLPAAGPVIVGVVLGGLVLLTLAWLGVATALDAAPRMRLVLTGGGAAYLAWLGGGMLWETRRSMDGANRSGTTGHRLPTHWLGVATFQLLNPKAWVMLVTATAVMARALDGPWGLGALAAIYALRSAVSLTLWAIAGSAIGRFLGEAGSRRRFDRAMGTLLVVLAGLLLVAEV